MGESRAAVAVLRREPAEPGDLECVGGLAQGSCNPLSGLLRELPTDELIQSLRIGLARLRFFLLVPRRVVVRLACDDHTDPVRTSDERHFLDGGFARLRTRLGRATARRRAWRT